MSELIGDSLNCPAQEAYIISLLSTLDSVFNEPLARLVEPLTNDILYKRALLEREGALGSVLDWVLEYEAGEWTQGQATQPNSCSGHSDGGRGIFVGAVLLLLAVVGGRTVFTEVMLVAQRLGDRPG